MKNPIVKLLTKQLEKLTGSIKNDAQLPLTKMFFEQFKFSSVDPSWFQIDGSNQWYLTALHKFHLQSTFHSRDIQFFVFLSFPLLLPVGHYFRGWSKMNPKVYDVINCLNKNSVTNFVWYLEKEKRYDIEYDIWVSDK